MQASEQLKAEPYERCEERQEYRNGTRERALQLEWGGLSFAFPGFETVRFQLSCSVDINVVNKLLSWS